MSRIVVVATSPVDREELADHVDATDELVVVVPAVEQSRLDWLANDEGKARGQAKAVGETIAQEAPTDAETIEVKPDSPSQAVLDAIAEHHPDRVVAVVRKGEEATWLEDGDEIPRELGGVPVTRVDV
jgi:hypothetical protein